MSKASKKIASFRIYACLNDFLPRKQNQKTFSYHFWGSPSIKNAIQAQNIPHTEVALVLVNSKIVDVDYHLKSGDHVSVYPVFKSFDISSISLWRTAYLEEFKFVIDANLGKLARYVRMLGFDSLYDNRFDDQEIIRISQKEKRIILTRDLEILKHNKVNHGYYLRSTHPRKQLIELVQKYDLLSCIHPFTRCMECNGILESVTRISVKDLVKDDIFEKFDEFFRCSSCNHIYWKGSHYDRMNETIRALESQ